MNNRIMKTRILPALVVCAALALGGCQGAATGEPGPGGWSGIVNPNKARDLAAAAAKAVRKGGSIIAGNYTPAKDTGDMAERETPEHDDPYIAACTVDQGTTSFSSGWMDFASAEFTIRKGEEKNIALRPKNPEASRAIYESRHQSQHQSRRQNRRPRTHSAGLNAGFWVTREKEGQNLIFCAEDPSGADNAAHQVAGAAQNDCIRVVVLEDYLSHGITRTLDIPGAVRGGTIACAYETPQFAAKAE